MVCSAKNRFKTAVAAARHCGAINTHMSLHLDPMPTDAPRHPPLPGAAQSWQGAQWLCRKPWFYAEIRHTGDVNVCCPNWNPVSVGRITEASLQEIWRGPRAQAVRRSILEGSYTWCNSSTCTLIRSNQLQPHTAALAARLASYWPLLPQHTHLVLDPSCNLACPSCRVDWQRSLPSGQLEQRLSVARLALDQLSQRPRDQAWTLSMDGSGEVWHSSLYRQLFDTHPLFTELSQWPGLQLQFTTNGTVMTDKLQTRYAALLARTEKLEVSIDAGDEHSYAVVRRGGDWQLLWENLRLFHDRVLLSQPHTRWRWNLILQAANYATVPQLIQLALTFQRQPEIALTPVLHWRRWSDSEYWQQAVHVPTHAQHAHYVEVMNSPLVRWWFRHSPRSSRPQI